MLIRWVTTDDIPSWKALSKQYDQYISEVATDFSRWYQGFDDYMNRKIEQFEAVIAIDWIDKRCNGIIAFSRTNNRITFFALSRTAKYNETAEKLITVALRQLDSNNDILISLPKGDSLQLKLDRDMFGKNGFEFLDEINMDGCPMIELIRKGNVPDSMGEKL